MKAAITDGKGRLWLDDVPVPKPGPYQCLCRVEACTSCTGTDRKHIHGQLPFFHDYPGILGHESIGVVTEVGQGVRYIREGERYLRPAAAYPGEQLGDLWSAWGGFAEYGLITDVRAMKEDQPDAEPSIYTRYQQPIPDDLGISPGDATALITLKENASWVSSAGVSIGMSVLVLGSGPVGYGMCWFAKAFGADPVIVVGRRDGPLAYAMEKAGADAVINTAREDLVARVRELTDGKGVDLIIETTGDAAVMKTSLATLGEGGKIAPYAVYEASDTVDEVVPAEKRAAATTAEHVAHEFMLDAVRLGMIKPGDFLSHRMPFDQICEGFDMLQNKVAFKTVFEMENA